MPSTIESGGDYAITIRVENNTDTSAATYVILTLTAWEHYSKVDETATDVFYGTTRLAERFTKASGYMIVMRFEPNDPITVPANSTISVNYSLHLVYTSGSTEWDCAAEWSGY